MHSENLIRMANQIAMFFEPMADQDAAIEAMAQHLKRFWNPRMRQQLVAAIDAGDADGLRDLARVSVEHHRKLLID